MHFTVYANSLKKSLILCVHLKNSNETFLSDFQTLCINKTGAEDQMHYVQNQQLSLKIINKLLVKTKIWQNDT